MRHLEHGDDWRSSGSKFVVGCSEITADARARTTAGWLDGITQLRTIDASKSLGMSHKKILEGLLRGRSRVVIKVADTAEDLEREWQAYSAVMARCGHTANFVRYHCFFRCDDRLPRVVQLALGNPSAGIGLCEGPGGAMQVLVMDHVDGKSMKHHGWSGAPARALQDFILQALFALLEAHLACGFRHGDFHLDNVLVARTRRATVTYPGIPGSPSIATHGLLAKLMDFELSSVGPRKPSSPAELFKDVMEFFRKASGDLALVVGVGPLQRCALAARGWVEDREADALRVLSLVPHVRELAMLGLPVRRGGSSARGQQGRAGRSSSPRRRAHPDIRKPRPTRP